MDVWTAVNRGQRVRQGNRVKIVFENNDNRLRHVEPDVILGLVRLVPRTHFPACEHGMFSAAQPHPRAVIPAQAGIQTRCRTRGAYGIVEAVQPSSAGRRGGSQAAAPKWILRVIPPSRTWIPRPATG